MADSPDICLLCNYYAGKMHCHYCWHRIAHEKKIKKLTNENWIKYGWLILPSFLF